QRDARGRLRRARQLDRRRRPGDRRHRPADRPGRRGAAADRSDRGEADGRGQSGRRLAARDRVRRHGRLRDHLQPHPARRPDRARTRQERCGREPRARAVPGAAPGRSRPRRVPRHGRERTDAATAPRPGGSQAPAGRSLRPLRGAARGRDHRRPAGRRCARAAPAPAVRGGKLAGWLALVGSLAALNYASRFSSGKPPADSLYRYDTALSGLIFYALTLGIVLLIARGLTPAELGLRRPASWPKALGFTLGVLVALLIAESVLEQLLHGAREQGLEPAHWNSAKAVQFALNAAVVVI